VIDGDDFNRYVNFVLYAVLGRMAEADGMMRRYSASIERVAARFAERFPVAPAPIYRGMLLDPSEPLQLDPRLTFLSWSEDRDVACWFASPDSVISAPLTMCKPTLRGALLTLPEPHRVLFHHTWGRGWARLALAHPHMGCDGARQIAWSLRTQREVITAPFELPAAEWDPASPPVAELDRRLTPPWMYGEIARAS
jgi:hypothetical protein